MFKDLLPIGSVVLLQGGTKKLMIIGIKPIKKDESKQTEEMYDYIGIPYPEGFISSEYNFLFNHSEINDVIFKGYNNPEREIFLNVLQKMYDEQNTDPQ